MLQFKIIIIFNGITLIPVDLFFFILDVLLKLHLYFLEDHRVPFPPAVPFEVSLAVRSCGWKVRPALLSASRLREV